MSPAEELRAAAATLRQTAAKAQAGPWGVESTGRTWAVLSYSTSGFVADLGRKDVPDTLLDGEWIALANPALAEPLAAWLDRAADHECLESPVACRDANRALDVARVINQAGVADA